MLNPHERNAVCNEYKIRLKHSMENNLTYPTLNEVAMDMYGSPYWELYNNPFEEGFQYNNVKPNATEDAVEDVKDSDNDIELDL